MFRLKEHGTNVRTEIIAGLTTFLTMAYIVVANPIILQDAGVPFAQAFTATIIASVVGCLIMAFWGNFPIAIAPGMGLNAYFAYSVMQHQGGIPVAAAFATVFVSAFIFLLLSFTPLRVKLIEVIPTSLKYAISSGIGLFIAFIGLRLTGLVQAHESNLIALGDLTTPAAALAVVGVLATITLMAANVPGALFIGMIITGVIAAFTGQLTFESGVFSTPSLPEGLYITNPMAAFGDVIEYGLYGAVFSFLLVTIFDTTGTFVGVANQAGLVKKDGTIPRASRGLLADSIAALVGSIFGTSPTTAFIESSAGVQVGGRTGLTSAVVAGLFVIAAFFSPLVGAVSNVSAITAPSLIIVGSLMMSNVRNIPWDEFDEAFPAFLVILTMPLTSSISTGIALGFITYPLLKVVKGKAREVHWLIYVFAALFLYQLIFLPH